MNVRCPHCATPFRLPPELMGPGGARVRCPACAGAFVVDAAGAVSGDPSPAAAAAEPAAEETPIEAARRVLADLAARHGAEIEDAIARGRLFSEHGQRLVEAYDLYRQRAAKRADAAAFRAALLERWGVDLSPHGSDPAAG